MKFLVSQCQQLNWTRLRNSEMFSILQLTLEWNVCLVQLSSIGWCCKTDHIDWSGWRLDPMESKWSDVFIPVRWVEFEELSQMSWVRSGFWVGAKTELCSNWIHEHYKYLIVLKWVTLGRFPRKILAELAHRSQLLQPAGADFIAAPPSPASFVD